MKKELNDILKSHVDRHEYDVDIQSVWDAVEKEIGPKKDNRKFLIIPVFLGLLFMGSLFFWNNPMESVNQMEALVEENQRGNQNSNQNVNHNLNENALGNLESNSEEDRNAKKSSDKEVIENRNNDSTQKKIQTNNLNSNQLKKQLNSNSSAIISGETFNFLKDQKRTSRKAIKNYNKITNEQKSSFKSKPFKRNTFSSNSIANSITEEGKYALIAAILPIEKPNFSIQNNRENPVMERLNFETLKALKTESRWGLNIWVGAAIVNSNLTAGSQVYKDALKIFETPIDAYRGGVLLSYNVKSNWYINSGITVNRIFSSVVWDGSYVVDIDGNLLPVSSIDGNGDPVYNFDNGIYFEEIEKTISGYNHQDFIDIPVSLHFVQKDKIWSPEIYAGVSFNVYNTSQGHFLNSYLVAEAINDKNYQLNVGLEYQFGAALNYRLTRKLGLRMGAQFSTRKVERQRAHLKYQIFELNSGLTYKF